MTASGAVDSSARSPNVSLPAAELSRFTVDMLMAMGVPRAHARTVADALVDADLAGLSSHGVMLLPMYLDRIAAGSVSPVHQGVVVSRNKGAVVFDAQDGLGQVTSSEAAALAVEGAKGHGIGTVAVRNGFHFGAAGRWAAIMAEEGCVGLVGCNTRPLMPAPGGAEAIVGNNPLAIAFPSGEVPLIVDFALSAAAMGKIRLAAASGDSIPDGWATDEKGLPTTDPAEAIRGMLLPAGGAKGFALAAAIDLLCGGLSEGAVGSSVRPLYGDPAAPYRCSHIFIAIDVGSFVNVDAFRSLVAGYVQNIRNSRAAPETEVVLAPGDRAIGRRLAAMGNCVLPRATADALVGAARSAGCDVPSALLQE